MAFIVAPAVEPDFGRAAILRRLGPAVLDAGRVGIRHDLISKAVAGYLFLFIRRANSRWYEFLPRGRATTLRAIPIALDAGRVGIQRDLVSKAAL